MFRRQLSEGMFVWEDSSFKGHLISFTQGGVRMLLLLPKLGSFQE